MEETAAKKRTRTAQTGDGTDKPVRRRRFPTNEEKLVRMVRNCVLEMIVDRENKPSDRLSAVKTLMEYFIAHDNANERELRVVFDDLPDGFAD